MKVYVSNISADTHERERLIGIIVNDKRNTFTRELLDTLDMFALNGIVKMLDPPPAPQTNAGQRPVPIYLGNTGAPPTSFAKTQYVEPPLSAPTTNEWCKNDALPKEQEQSQAPVSKANVEPPLPLPRRMI